jgi:hypothetical protein
LKLNRTLNLFVADKAAILPKSEPDTPVEGNIYWDTTSKVYKRYSSGWSVIGEYNNLVKGRLSVSTTQPISISSSGNNNNVYFIPFNGNYIHLYENSKWTQYIFSSVSVSMTGTTADTAYDVFLYSASGSVISEIVAWTDTSTRATELAWQDGYPVKTGATSRLYVGSFLTNSTIRIDDLFNKRGVYNYFNRVPRAIRLNKNSSHSYITEEFRYYNNDATSRIELFLGTTDHYINAYYTQLLSSGVPSGNPLRYMKFGIGADSSSAVTTEGKDCWQETTTNNIYYHSSFYLHNFRFSTVGAHYISMLEYGNADFGNITNGTLQGIYEN